MPTPRKATVMQPNCQVAIEREKDVHDHDVLVIRVYPVGTTPHVIKMGLDQDRIWELIEILVANDGTTCITSGEQRLGHVIS